MVILQENAKMMPKPIAWAAPNPTRFLTLTIPLRQYTSEYMKGPMYWHPDKMQGFAPDYPGRPIVKNGKYTSPLDGFHPSTAWMRRDAELVLLKKLV